MNDKEYLEKCKAGNHPLRIILTSKNDGFDTCSVVRWCSICGAVVIDTEHDGRTYPGRMMQMKIPKITSVERKY